MKTKCVYVLVSTESDYYLEQTLISVYSLRYYNPNANITVVADRDTSENLKGKRAEIKKYVSDFVVIECPHDYDNMKKSRYIKTNLRKFLTGDFLYIDCDTVISDSLNEIDNFDGEIGAVYDSNRNFMIANTQAHSDTYINNNTTYMNWPSMIGWPNYNGGVLFVRDTDTAHTFYQHWYDLWIECTKKNLNIDMLALCRSNVEMGGVIKQLPGIWNCQIQRQGLALIHQAKIIHCFTGGNVSMYSLCTDRVLNMVKSLGVLNDEIIEMIKNAKTAFEIYTTVVPAKDARILTFPIGQLYYYNYTLFRILNKIAEVWFKIVKGRSFQY